MIATEPHRRAFEAALEAHGVDVGRAKAEGTLLSLDAATTLSEFRGGGKIDHDAFHDVIGGVVRSAAACGRPVRAYGEMVALLWDAGDVLAAIELERLWNELGPELPFTLFCSYPAASVAGPDTPTRWPRSATCIRRCSAPRLRGDKASQRGRRADGHQRRLSAPSRQLARPARARLVADALRRWGTDEHARQRRRAGGERAGNERGAPCPARRSRSRTRVRLELRVAVDDAVGLATEPGLADPAAAARFEPVDALCTCWGVDGHARREVVWAELPYDPGAGVAVG